MTGETVVLVTGVVQVEERKEIHLKSVPMTAVTGCTILCKERINLSAMLASKSVTNLHPFGYWFALVFVFVCLCVSKAV